MQILVWGNFRKCIHFLRVQLHTISCYDFSAGRNLHAPEMASIFVLRFSHLYIWITCFSIISWSLPFSSYPTIRMWPAMPITLSRSLNISSIFSGTCPLSMLHLVVAWYICFYKTNRKKGCRWWFFGLIQFMIAQTASIFVRYCVGGRSTSLTVWPLCTEQMCAWISVIGSRQSSTVSLGSGSNMRLLHHSPVSSIPIGTMICWFLQSISFWRAPTVHMPHTLVQPHNVSHHLLPALKWAFEAPIPWKKKSALSLCTKFVGLALAFMSTSLSSPTMK